jgi:ferredoxin
MSNPFATLTGLPDDFMRVFLCLMVLAVVIGTLVDIVHKGSAKYFFANFRKARAKGSREVAGGELLSIAVQTAVVDVLASGEFCNPRRRLAHVLTMYGFLLYVGATAWLVFVDPSPGFVVRLWWIGGLMILIGGYWFWFFIRVDVAAEGNSPWRLVRADLFIVSLLASVTLGLAWAAAGGGYGFLFRLYALATAILFGSVYWSKFAHMFFKPAAAFEKRVSKANGTAGNLPLQSRDDPEQQKRHSMELLKDAPMDMGLGIKREPPATTRRTHATFVYMTRCDGCGHCVDICPVRHHAHRPDLSARLQHRAEHVLGVLLLREGLPAERDRRARLCRLRPARPQRPRGPRREEGHDRLEDRLPRRHGKELPLAHHHEAVGTAIPSSRMFPRRAAMSARASSSTTSRNGSAWTRGDCARSRTRAEAQERRVLLMAYKTIVEDGIDILVGRRGPGRHRCGLGGAVLGPGQEDRHRREGQHRSLRRGRAGLYAINCYMGTRWGENNPRTMSATPAST